MNWKLLNSDSVLSPSFVPRKKNVTLAAANIIGAGISAAAGIAGSAMTNAANANLDWDNREWQEKMWHMSNAYNTAKAQRARLEAAGINPALAMQGSGTGGVAASAPTPNQHTPADWSGLGSGINQGIQNWLAAQRLDVESQNILADTEIKHQMAMTTFSEGMARIENLLSQSNLSKSQRYYLDYQLETMKEMFPLVKAQSYAQLEGTLAQTQLTNQMKLAKAFEMEMSEKRYMLDKQLTTSQISAISQQIVESMARIRQTDESIALNAKAIANDVIHSMNIDASAFENIGLSKELISSQKFSNYVGSVVGGLTNIVGAAGIMYGSGFLGKGAATAIQGFRR